ncbi:hypothetical protein [Streptomyces sp. NPDC057010]|uniref:hypothetical protein n=1 Tax=Streptomyces sp. NPDC057010 TaxID=3345997 RepID=UPI0036458447
MVKLTKRCAATLGTALAALLIGTGGAQAADDGSLLSILGLPSVTLACFPVGQAGTNNQFTGTQNISCSQSASQTNPAPTPPTPPSGGVTGAYTAYSSEPALVPANGVNQAVATCPAGKTVTGGGYLATANFFITNQFPTVDGTGWGVTAAGQGQEGTITAIARCVDGAP